MDWSVYDFLLMGGMLAAGGISISILLSVTPSWPYRLGGVIAVLGAFLLIWISGAVGIIGRAGHVGNLLLLGVLPVGITGAAMSKLKARGLALTLMVMAALQFGVAGLALLLGWGAGAERWPWDVIFGNGLFCTIWLIAAGLFMTTEKAGSPDD